MGISPGTVAFLRSLGIEAVHLHELRPHNVNHYLGILVEDHREALGQGAIFSVSEGQIRVRTLPIDR
jgi:hypothetical protein